MSGGTVMAIVTADCTAVVGANTVVLTVTDSNGGSATANYTVNVTANTAEHKALLKRFSLFGPPGIIFFDAQGREIKGLRVIGYQNAERFLKTLSLATRP